MTTTCRFEAPLRLRHATQRVVFASCFVYSPSGAGVVSQGSRVVCALIKAGEVRALSALAVQARRDVTSGGALAGVLESGSVLVPVPGRAPCAPGERSVPERFAAALTGEGLGQRLWCGLRRARRVRKSATAPPGLRPTVEDHYLSFVVDPTANPPTRIVLVDDVVTKGRTLLAAAMCLWKVFPSADIRAFAIMRTLGYGEAIQRLRDPCVGEIWWSAGDAQRSP